MDAHSITSDLSVAPQIRPDDIPAIASAGFRSILCNRPDAESPDQPSFREIEQRAEQAGLVARYLPVTSGHITDADVAAFEAATEALPKPVLAYCRTGTRSATLWSHAEARRGQAEAEILAATKAAGYDLEGAGPRMAGRSGAAAERRFTVVIVGGGAAGIAAASSLKARKPDLEVAVIDPADVHYYQPGWTMVGAGVFDQGVTARSMASLIPDGVTWIKAGVVAFEPQRKAVVLEGGRTIGYDRLVVAPGLTLNWAGIEGLEETLGRNGVTSNYRFDLAPYTWELVQGLGAGRAVFTQPPMPIKCAGAPQKAMYLSADHWRRAGRLKDIGIDLFTATPGLFGVKEYVPPLMEYVRRYDAKLHFRHNLTRIDGSAKRAWFTSTAEDGTPSTVETAFDMIHVVPPQQAPDFIRQSPLADPGGWVEVDPASLRHTRFADIYGLGDACSTPNAKTAAAARKQAPVVAHNLLRDMGFISRPEAVYDGYGSCPLTVERGKILLAEFGYGGKLLPSFPSWLLDGTKPSRAAWLLKERMLPPIYWRGMLKGREWMAKPKLAV
ncbi:NAD(FAD)-dependent dehydrogenase [Methylobacterium sp. Leaf123]|uniref:bifunctional protein tyrosine phosphatase family protein/NAD(P)/FAD-dependent oxidoreductase n=1 Tax=Methylobacterium sp. Leaf123 TaxID=1736264 RepID=UPI0006FCE89D|nr:bifunctional protein tyrosine phosphatase family protein/NAD(P)/FAD-dependent oxidoreductase [Methylobacterium sp. Leaf123]KQQ14205.1 NAD(FAD)-dependent dehydrogenase [Methylobacterium sp. Leaf123]